MRNTQRRRQRGFINRKAMVLAGDHDVSARLIQHRMVGAVMSELPFHRFGAAGETEQLMAETNAKYWNVGLEKLHPRSDGVIAGLRIAGSVGQEDTVGIQC